jgi:hypothetical protein
MLAYGFMHRATRGDAVRRTRPKKKPVRVGTGFFSFRSNCLFAAAWLVLGGAILLAAVGGLGVNFSAGGI